MNRIILSLLLIAIIISSCKKESVQHINIIDKQKIAEITKDGLTATLWSDNTSLQTGYTKIYISLKDIQSKEIKNASVTYLPVMDMVSMGKKHSSPKENPRYNDEINLYEGAVVFTMPSSATDGWQLDVSVNGKPISFPLTIATSSKKSTGSYLGTDGEKYVVSLIPPAKWQVGLNDLEIFISKQLSMMEFTAEDGFTIEFEPEMPSMDHGSPNNTNPISIGNGHYIGKVNYTMTGDWRLHFKLKKNNEVIVDDAYVDVLF